MAEQALLGYDMVAGLWFAMKFDPEPSSGEPFCLSIELRVNYRY